MQPFFSLCAQSHSAVTVTMRPVILGVLKWEPSPNERTVYACSLAAELGNKVSLGAASLA